MLLTKIGADPETFALYAGREETRRDHTARLMAYLDTRSATAQDHRAALLAAIQAAAMSDARRGAVYDPEEVVSIIEGKPARKGATGTWPDRAIAVHDRMVLKSSVTPALPGRPQQG